MKINEVFKNKKIVIVFIVLTILIIGIVWAKIKSTKQEVPKQEVKKEEILPKSEILPTVDSSVLVDLTSKDKKEAILTIKSIPNGTLTIEYELSYLAKGNLPKGVIGTINIEGENSIERKITLGTCSSGSCVYDEGVTSIKVNLKFEGDYGSRLFEKEFEI